MTRRERFEQLLFAELDGPLTAEESAELAALIAETPEFAREAAQQHALQALLNAAPDHAPAAPPDLLSRVLRELPEQPTSPQNSPMRRYLPYQLAAAAAIMVMGTLTLVTSRNPEVEPVAEPDTTEAPMAFAAAVLSEETTPNEAPKTMAPMAARRSTAVEHFAFEPNLPAIAAELPSPSVFAIAEALDGVPLDAFIDRPINNQPIDREVVITIENTTDRATAKERLRLVSLTVDETGGELRARYQLDELDLAYGAVTTQEQAATLGNHLAAAYTRMLFLLAANPDAPLAIQLNPPDTFVVAEPTN